MSVLSVSFGLFIGKAVCVGNVYGIQIWELLLRGSNPGVETAYYAGSVNVFLA